MVFREGRTKAVGNVNKVTKILDWEGLKCQQGDKHSNICKDVMQIKLVNRIDSICMKSSLKWLLTGMTTPASLLYLLTLGLLFVLLKFEDLLLS